MVDQVEGTGYYESACSPERAGVPSERDTMIAFLVHVDILRGWNYDASAHIVRCALTCVAFND